MPPPSAADADTELVYQLADLRVFVQRNRVEAPEGAIALEPKVMDILVCLIEHQGHVVSKTALLDRVWAGRFVVDGVLKRGISKLRSALGDSAKAPRYVETVQRRGYRLVAPVERIEPLAGPPTLVERSPFRGLAAFRYEDADVFFGRERQVREVLDALTGQRDAGRAFVLISGPSGCGKSSLAQAGVLPALCAADGAPYAIVRFARAAGDVFDTLAAALRASSAFADAHGADGRVARILREADDGLIEWLDQALADNQRLTILFDQFEELFAPAISSAERAAMIDTMHAMARSGRVNVLVTLRNDQFHWFVQSDVLNRLRLPHGHVEVRSPGPVQLAQIIREPARRAGLRFAVDRDGRTLDDTLLTDAQQHTEVLPLLEFTLTELYEQRGDDGELSLAAYQALGGIGGCVARRAEQIFADVSALAQAELAPLLSSMVVVGQDREAVSLRSAALPDDATAWAAWPLVSAFADARLFTLSGGPDGDRRVEIAHAAVLTLWPRAKRWLADNLQSLRIRAWLGEQTARWRDAQYHRDYLLRSGQPLNDALAACAGAELDDDERRFVAASETRVRRTRRIRTGAVAALAALAFATTVTTFHAAKQRSLAEAASEQSTRIADFLGDVFRSADPVSGRRDSLTAHELLERGARRVNEELANQPAMAASLLHTMGEAYYGLGDYAASVDALRDARAFAGDGTGRKDRELAHRIDANLARALVALGELDEARAVIARALDGIDRLDAPLIKAQLLEERGQLAYRDGDLENAMRDTQSALGLRRANPTADERGVAACYVNLGAIEHARGNSIHAESNYLRAIEIYRAASPAADDELAAVLNNLANVYRLSGRAARAEQRYREALAIHASLYPPDHPDTAGIRSNLGSVLRDLGRVTEAVSVLEQSHSVLARQLGETHPTTCLIAVKLADVLVRDGQAQRAEPLLALARQHLEARYGKEHYLSEHVNAVAGTALAHADDLAGAEQMLLASRAAIQRLVGTGSPFYHDATRRLAEVLERKGDIPAADALRAALAKSP